MIQRLQVALDEEEFGGMINGAGTTENVDVTEKEVEKEAKVQPDKNSNVDSEETKESSGGDKVVVEGEDMSKDTVAVVESSPSQASTAKGGKISLKSIKETDALFEEKKAARAKRFNIPPSFEEKKAARAKRFNIPVIGNKNDTKQERKKDKKDNKRNLSGKEAGKKYEKKAKVGVVMSKEEIEKNIKRAEKFGSTKNLDALKAMLRKYRFTS